MVGELVLDDMCDELSFSICNTGYDFAFSIYVDKEHKLEEEMKKTNLIVKAIDDDIDFLYQENLITKEKLELYNYLKEKSNELYEHIEFIKVVFEKQDVLEFIENNPIVQSKKIVIPDVITILDYNKVIELLQKYDKYKDIIYISMENNQWYVKLEDCVETINRIKLQAQGILQLNLSPIETIMYTYDKVRNRVYKFESEMDSPSKSRDLNSVLMGDEIVCAGYANIFDALLHYMGFKCQTAGLTKSDKSSGHLRNIVYVEDKKYDIDGVYYFDATWDSKRINETNEFLNRYIFFAKTRQQMVELENNNYIYDFFEYYSNDMYNEVKQLLDQEDLFVLNKRYGAILNYMSRIVDGKNMIDRSCLIPGLPYFNCFDRDLLLRKLKEVLVKFDNPISAEKYIKILNNVRKVQYYENSEFYPYTFNNLFEACIRSMWEFDKHYLNSQKKLLLSIFNESVENSKEEDIINYMSEEQIGKDIKRVQLTKILRRYHDSRN